VDSASFLLFLIFYGEGHLNVVSYGAFPSIRIVHFL